MNRHGRSIPTNATYVGREWEEASVGAQLRVMNECGLASLDEIYAAREIESES